MIFWFLIFSIVKFLLIKLYSAVFSHLPSAETEQQNSLYQCLFVWSPSEQPFQVSVFPSARMHLCTVRPSAQNYQFSFSSGVSRVDWVALELAVGVDAGALGQRGEVPGDALPATPPSPWASTSEHRSGSLEAASGSWVLGGDASETHTVWRSREICICVCLWVCVCSDWGHPKQICLLVINSPDWHNRCRSFGKAEAYVRVWLRLVYRVCILSMCSCEFFCRPATGLCVQEAQRSPWHWGHFHVTALGARFPAERPGSSLSSID